MIKNWLKQQQVWGFFVSVAVMAAISLAFFAPDNFQGNSLSQHDMQQGVANGQEAVAYQQATGEKALWTNALFSGMPTFQISPSYPSNSLFAWINDAYGLWLPSPSNLLFMMMMGFLIMLYCMKQRWWIALIGAVAWGFSSYFIIIIGAGHIWKFLALTYVPPTIGGLVLCYRRKYLAGAAITALAATMQLNANHPQMTYYFGFVMAGLAIAFLVEAYREKTLKQWLVATGVAAVAGVLALGANLPSLYNTYEYAKETKRAQSELAEPASPGAAPAERPTGGLPKGEIVNWSYGGSEMFSLLVPNIKGGASMKPEKGQTYALTLDKLDGAGKAPYDVQPLLPFFSQYFNDSEGTNGPVYVGAIICALFLLGCFIVKGPVKWALLALTVISMLLALGRNFEGLTDFMIYNFPMYSKFRAVESILVIAEFTMPLLAILALAQVLAPKSLQGSEMAEEGGRCIDTQKALMLAFGICALVCLAGIAVPSIFGDAITSQDTQTVAALQQYYPDANISAPRVYEAIADMRYGMLRADAWRSLVLLAIAFCALWLYTRKGRGNALAPAAVIGLAILVDLYSVDKRYVAHESFVQGSQAAAAAFVPDDIDRAILADTAQSYRVMDIPGFWSPDRSYFHKMVGGYHAAKLNRYEDLIQNRLQHVINLPQLAKAIGADSNMDALQLAYMPDSVLAQYPEQLQAIAYELDADLRVLDMLNARYIITGDPDAPVIANPDALGNAWLVSSLAYVDNAREEMNALGTIDPATEAVADRKFLSALGDDVVAPEPGDYIKLVRYTPNQLTYDASLTASGIGVFSEVYFPWGWHATIDGQAAPLARVNYVLRAMRIPAGKHTIVMTFDPASVRNTSAVAYASVTLIYLIVLAALFMPAILRRNGVAGQD